MAVAAGLAVVMLGACAAGSASCRLLGAAGCEHDWLDAAARRPVPGAGDPGRATPPRRAARPEGG